MWRNLASRAVSRKFRLSSEPQLLGFYPSSAEFSKYTSFLGKMGATMVQSGGNWRFGFLGFRRFESGFSDSGRGFDTFRGFLCDARGYASVAEEIVSEEDSSSGSEEIHELLEEMERENKTVSSAAAAAPEPSVRAGPKKTVGRMGVAKYQMLQKRQFKMETKAWDQAAKEYQELLVDMCEKKLAPNLPYVKSLLLGWFEPLRDAIVADQKACKNNRYKPSYAPYFMHLPADMTAVITMHTLMGLLISIAGAVGSVRVVQAACQIGEALEFEVRLQRLLKKFEEANAESKSISPEQERRKKQVTQMMKRQKVQQLMKLVKELDDSKPWGQEAQVKVGCRLIQLLIETAYIQPPVDQVGDSPPNIRPAFIHNLKTITKDTQKTSRRYGVIECDPLVQRGLEKTARHLVIPYMPMLVPPQNWTGYDKGAYLFLPSYIMRTHGSKRQREAVKRTSRNQLEPVFEALNTLGSTKWRVNKRMLAVINRIWSAGGSLAGLVSRKNVPLPPEPITDDESEIREWKWKLKAAKKKNKERHSQRCDVELKLAVARKMMDEEGFYYPHNVDFRGRAYPMHPYLNHLGSDLCRGILEFAEGRPLGKSGLRWLKIHLANVYAGGVDKLSYDDRVAFTENHLDDIFDSADRPLEGNRWWIEAEDPFQCLATCINLSEALRSPSPETMLSHMPVHQDGSCNGLQHYAALGRDKLGAEAVNLVGGEKPADVYSGIAARVLDIMRKDASDDPATNPRASCARNLINQVDRKLVKQTVMTSVYGVTYIGARDQIKKRLKERNAIANDGELYSAACYAARTTLTALEEMFEAARSIMDWLGDCARVITSQNQAVQWTTPLGLPVVQPYRQLGRHLIKTSLQVLTLQRETDKVMVKRQRTAFPPNFVHSLDGSHMMMTAVACKKAGLNFAGVHDSYWTHACDVDVMNRILREKFVELYEAPILENLLENFQKSFPDSRFPPLPHRGDFDLREVLESPYFFN